MKRKLLSILTNLHNESRNIGEFLESPENQTYKNLELVLVDGARQMFAEVKR